MDSILESPVFIYENCKRQLEIFKLCKSPSLSISNVVRRKILSFCSEAQFLFSRQVADARRLFLRHLPFHFFVRPRQYYLD